MNRNVTASGVRSAEIKRLCHHFIEEFNKGKAAALTVLEETDASNVVYHTSTGEDMRGLKRQRVRPVALEFVRDAYDANRIQGNLVYLSG